MEYHFSRPVKDTERQRDRQLYVHNIHEGKQPFPLYSQQLVETTIFSFKDIITLFDNREIDLKIGLMMQLISFTHFTGFKNLLLFELASHLWKQVP